ncbi:MAG: cation transporter, partial [Deinococcus sp.]|nr:cation transporter [Deinococcus sp.]
MERPLSAIESSLALAPERRARLKRRAALASVFTAAGLLVVKVVAAALTGSLAVLSEAANSGLDVVSSSIAAVLIKLSDEPADAEHPYGHGKLESLSGLIQSAIILVTAGSILTLATRRFLSGTLPSQPDAGMVVMLLSMAVSLGISRYLEQQARRTSSPALAADAVHFRMDLLTGLAALLALAGVRLTGHTWPDALGALIIVMYIVFQVWGVARRAVMDLIDTALPQQFQAEVDSIISQFVQDHHPDTQEWHRVRTRRAGSQIMMDLHLLMQPDLPVSQAHALSDRLVAQLKARFPGAHVLIHLEPADHHHGASGRPG